MQIKLPEDYEHYIRENTTTRERQADSLTTADQRINYAVAQIANLQAKVDAVIAMLSRGGIGMGGKTEQIRVQETMAALTGNTFRRTVDFDAIMSSIVFHFPTGCNALVDVAAGYNNIHAFPREGYLALDGATPVIPTYIVLKRADTVWVEINNHDAVNAHTITVSFTLQERFA